MRKRKLISLLVLLMTAVTGAWAQTISLDFEDGDMPQGWTHYGARDAWYVDVEDYYGHTPAFSGTYSLYIDGHGVYDHDYFVSPAINFQGEGSLSFAYSTKPWSGDFNDLTVAYSTSPDGPWTPTSFVEQTSDGWTTATVDLSSLNGTYYIAFISYDGYGYSTAIDNINFVGYSVAPAAPTAVTANIITPTTADISWTGNDEATSYNLRYRPYNDVNITDFEASSMGEWTTIDADGDGFDWVLGSACGDIYLTEGADLVGGGYGGSQDFVTSGSYSNVYGVLTPDNYLVSPLIDLGGSISFYAWAQDESYAAEHFGVAVSTTSNTDPDAFTTIQEWTMTPAGTPAASSRMRKGQGQYGHYVVDLSAYAGQTGYVAIRHFGCTDQFLLNIDDIEIELPGAEEEPWTEVSNVTNPYTITGLTPGAIYEVGVQAVSEGGNSVWASTSFTMPNSITLAEEDDNTTKLADWDGYEADVTLTRTLMAGGYNTFAVPFDLAIPEGWTVKELNSASFANDVLTLNFATAQSIEAGKPYLVKVAANVDLSAAPFTGVTVSKDAVPYTSETVDFIPTLGATTIPAGDPKAVLFFAADNTLLNPSALPANIKGFRAYFQLKGEVVQQVRAFSLDFGDGESTGIRSIESNGKVADDAIYTLDGRRVSQPTKGIYIQNGKKLIIK